MEEVEMAKKIRVRKRYKPKQVLETWRELLRSISKMNEAELKAALDDEMAKHEADRRKDVVVRLHRRYNKVKSQRERKEMIS